MSARATKQCAGGHHQKEQQFTDKPSQEGNRVKTGRGYEAKVIGEREEHNERDIKGV